MNQAVNEWPQHYTEDVPPLDAKDTKGLVFRLVENAIPQPSDFKSTVEEEPNRQYETNEEFVIACGASHYTKFDEIKAVRELFPKLRRKRIASGVLLAEMGKMKATMEGSHCTVWYKVTALPHIQFTVVS